MIDWLPETIELSDHQGNWRAYEAAVYAAFMTDFVSSKPLFRGKALALKRHPVVKDKEATYWHIISDGKDEQDRIPNLRRCERIKWAKAVVEHADDPAVKIWVVPNGSEKRIHLWLEEACYLVVLAQRQTYIIFWTAFYIEHAHQARKYQKAYDAYQAQLRE